MLRRSFLQLIGAAMLVPASIVCAPSRWKVEDEDEIDWSRVDMHFGYHPTEGGWVEFYYDGALEHRQSIPTAPCETFKFTLTT